MPPIVRPQMSTARLPPASHPYFTPGVIGLASWLDIAGPIFARELMQSQPELLGAGASWRAWPVQGCDGKFDRILKSTLLEDRREQLVMGAEERRAATRSQLEL